MFQYALGYHLQLIGRKVVYDRTLVHTFRNEQPHDRCQPQYGLDGYDTDVEFGPRQEKGYPEKSLFFDPGVFEVDDVTLDGYWQSEKYFPSDGGPLGHPLVHRFFPKLEPTEAMRTAAAGIMDPNSVAVQVRRGDYTWPKITDFHGVMTREYFEEGIKITGAKNVYIFTDDVPWCRMTFPDAEIANTGSRHWDIALMAGAANAVISNSTFGWWGAWLGDHNFIKPGRRVVAPKKWFADPKANLANLSIVPPRWIQI